MNNKLIWMPLASLLFLGCSKMIKINNRTHAVNEEPIQYHEEVPTYELEPIPESRVATNNMPTYELDPVVESNVGGNNIPYPEESIPTPESIPTTTTKPFNIEPLDAFDKILENPNVLILDVRLLEEIHKDGKIANSVLIPLQVLGQNLNRLDKSKEIIVYCHTGNRSTVATKLLRKNGFDAINMKGGIEAWKRNHLEVKWK